VRDGATLNTIGDLHAGTTWVAGSLTSPRSYRHRRQQPLARRNFNYIGGVQGGGQRGCRCNGSITDGYTFFIGAGTAGAGAFCSGRRHHDHRHGMLGHVSGANGTATVTGEGSV